jgi:hypothetical protein
MELGAALANEYDRLLWDDVERGMSFWQFVTTDAAIHARVAIVVDHREVMIAFRLQKFFHRPEQIVRASDELAVAKDADHL